MDIETLDKHIAVADLQVNQAQAGFTTLLTLVRENPGNQYFQEAMKPSAESVTKAQDLKLKYVEMRSKLMDREHRIPKAERHSAYKQSTADVHGRRYLTDVSVHLAAKCKLHVTVTFRKPDGTIGTRVKAPNEVTMGDVFFCFDEKNRQGKPMYPELCQVFGYLLGSKRFPNAESILNEVDGPWRYLKALNEAVNGYLHCGLSEENGEAKFICKEDFFQSSLIQEIWALSGCEKRQQKHGPPKIVKLVLQKENDVSSSEGSPKSVNDASSKPIVDAGAIPLSLDSPAKDARALSAASGASAVSVAPVQAALVVNKKKKKSKIKSVATECSAILLSADSSKNTQVPNPSLELLPPYGSAAASPPAIAQAGFQTTL